MFKFIAGLALLTLTPIAAAAQDEPPAPLALFETSRTLRAEAVRAAETGDYEAARRALNAASALQPGHPGILLGLVQIGMASGNDDLLLVTLEAVAEAGIAFDLSRLGGSDARLRETYPDRYAALDGSLARHSGPAGEAERAAHIALPDSLIEGIAVEIETDRIFLSDVVGRKVWVVEPFDRSSAQVFADADDGLQSVFGLAADDVNRVIWAASGTLPQTPLDEGEEPATALVALDMITGDVYRRYDYDGAERIADIVTRDGIVYAVDSGANRIYQLTSLSGRLRLLSDDPRFAGLQGAALANGALYVADYALGLWRVDLTDGTAQQVRPGPESLIGIDGLSATREGRLIAVRKGVSPHAVIAIDLAPDGLSVANTEILVRNHADFGEPALVDVQDDRVFFIANAPWALWPEDGSGPAEAVPPTVILEYDLD
ncbi:MAG: hypothetical protein COW29_03780 [Rhodobacterales bacterium CG15_BIG_FIL_POST_REV_8_21_14_020_59_13]|nr:MAG: hypothetical protein COW29_03780 [Rhodobacterales bacterium CG15_BIG_FIL_POST_REV_8_21_14_020_59_13]